MTKEVKLLEGKVSLREVFERDPSFKVLTGYAGFTDLISAKQWSKAWVCEVVDVLKPLKTDEVIADNVRVYVTEHHPQNYSYTRTVVKSGFKVVRAKPYYAIQNSLLRTFWGLVWEANELPQLKNFFHPLTCPQHCWLSSDKETIIGFSHDSLITRQLSALIADFNELSLKHYEMPGTDPTGEYRRRLVREFTTIVSHTMLRQLCLSDYQDYRMDIHQSYLIRRMLSPGFEAYGYPETFSLITVVPAYDGYLSFELKQDGSLEGVLITPNALAPLPKQKVSCDQTSISIAINDDPTAKFTLHLRH